MNTKSKRILLTLGVAVLAALGVTYSSLSASESPKELHITGGGEQQLNTPMGVTSDGSKIYIANAGKNQIDVFDQKGKWVSQIGRGGTKEGELNYPVDAALSPTGGLYVADFYNQRIQVFSTSGAFQFSFPKGERIRPAALDIDSSGNVYVADVNSQSIKIYSPKGELIREIGGPGTGNGQFNFPNGIAVNQNGTEIYVSDSQNNRVQVFDGQGEFLRMIQPKDAMGLPKGIALADDGRLYVTDALLHKVYIFDQKGILQETWGQQAGAFHFPNDVFVKNGKVLIVDRGNNQVIVYSQKKL